MQLTQAGSYAVAVSNSGFGNQFECHFDRLYCAGHNVIQSRSGTVGMVVNVSGVNFDPTPGNNIVYFGAVRGGGDGASATNLTVTVPVGATYAPITETVNGLVAYAYTAFQPTFIGDGSGISVNFLLHGWIWRPERAEQGCDCGSGWRREAGLGGGQ